jgi:hypothetical protein
LIGMEDDDDRFQRSGTEGNSLELNNPQQAAYAEPLI